MRWFPLGGFASRSALVTLLAATLAPQTARTEDWEEETEEDRTEQLMETVLAVLRRSAAHRSLLDDALYGSRSDRLVAYKLRTTKISLKLEDHGVEEVLDFLRHVSGLNFVISPRAREAIEASEDRVSFSFQGLTIENLLNLLDRSLRHTRFTVRYGAVILVHNDEYRPRRVLRVYDVRDIVRKPRDFAAPRLGLGDNEP